MTYLSNSSELGVPINKGINFMILLLFSSNIGLLTMYEINVVFLDQCKNKIPYKLRTVVSEVLSFADNPKSTSTPSTQM